MKIENTFLFDGEKYTKNDTLVGGVTIYISENDKTVLFADKNMEVFKIITGGCGQNEGYLKIQSII